MSFVAAAQSVYNADDLAKFFNIPESFRGQRVRIVPDSAVLSKGGVAYYPFTSEEEATDWLDCAAAEWWDDEEV